jgi:glycosyltransferase involved in cell wall biosynthesis
MRVNLFSIGDSNDINTWSNVPYFFARSLTRRGIEVVRLNIDPHVLTPYTLLHYYRRAVARLRHPHWDEFHTRSSYWIGDRHVRRLSERNRHADLNLFLTFSFSSYRYSNVPVYHYCDRTYEHQFLERGGRPTRADHAIFEIEKRNLQNADGVFHWDSASDEFVRERYHVSRSQVIPAGINLENTDIDPATLIARKESSHEILFIGRCTFQRGVDVLLDAFRMFNEQHSNAFTLQVLGVSRDHINVKDPRVILRGYLRKDHPAELQEYLNLLASARLFVFPMRVGPIPGVIREAQLMCLPVIMTNVGGAAQRIRHEHDGILVDSLEPAAFAAQMDALVRDRPRWRTMAWNAHRRAVGETWDRAIDLFLNSVCSWPRQRLVARRA